MKKPKLLMCYHSAEFGGVEKQILDIITGLSGDWEITVVCPDGPLVEKYLNAGAVSHINLKPRFEADFYYSWRIFRIVKQGHYDVIHSHELLTGSLATFAAFLAGCKKRVYHVHTPFIEWRHSKWKKYIALIANTIVNFFVGNIFATDVIALSPSIKETRIKKEFILASKISVIPNGVDLDNIQFSQEGRRQMRKKWKLGAGETIIGNLSRFTEEKGQEVLIRAFADLIKRNLDTENSQSRGDLVNIKLILSGGGKLLPKMKTLVEKLRLQNYVIFTDRFEDEEKINILSSFDLFVFPTYAEGFGIVLLESMAVGLPCIVSDIPVLKDIGENAVEYIPVGSVSTLAAALKEMVENRDKMEKLAKKSRKQAEKYSIERFWQNYRSLYIGK